jgi:hypothetical protein
MTAASGIVDSNDVIPAINPDEPGEIPLLMSAHSSYRGGRDCSIQRASCAAGENQPNCQEENNHPQ